MEEKLNTLQEPKMLLMKLLSSQIIHPRGPVKSRTKKKQWVDEYSGAKEGVVLR